MVSEFYDYLDNIIQKFAPRLAYQQLLPSWFTPEIDKNGNPKKTTQY